LGTVLLLSDSPENEKSPVTFGPQGSALIQSDQCPQADDERRITPTIDTRTLMAVSNFIDLSVAYSIDSGRLSLNLV
jgi:hypothetical protein